MIHSANIERIEIIVVCALLGIITVQVSQEIEAKVRVLQETMLDIEHNIIQIIGIHVSV